MNMLILGELQLPHCGGHVTKPMLLQLSRNLRSPQNSYEIELNCFSFILGVLVGTAAEFTIETLVSATVAVNYTSARKL